jgi:hypothetical protein
MKFNRGMEHKKEGTKKKKSRRKVLNILKALKAIKENKDEFLDNLKI